MGDVIQLWLDVADPWSYLASVRLSPLAARAGVAWVPRPVVLAPDSPTPPARAAMRRIDLVRTAARAGIELARTQLDPEAARAATRRLATRSDPPHRVARVLRAVWGEGLDPLEVVGEIGDGCADLTAEARAAGVFATPSFTVGDTTIWGVDRLHRLEQRLGLPVDPAPIGAAAEGATWEWFHDLASPFSYLASTQIPRLEAGLGIAPTVTPILLGALFRGIGTPMVPLQSFSAARRAWVGEDLEAWARWWGVPLRFPGAFPLRTVVPLRILLLAPQACPALYRAAWVEDRDIGDPRILAEVLDEVGLDGAGLLERAADRRVKEQLRINTQRAQELGICGVPSFRIGEDALVWGQDRLDHVVWLMGGWRGGARRVKLQGVEAS